MSKFTSGPWKTDVYITNEAKAYYEVFADDKPQTYICKVCTDNPDFKANAQLISAAPELLEAAEKLLNFRLSKHEDLFLEGQKELEEAIKKSKRW